MVFPTLECPVGFGRIKDYQDCEPCPARTFNDGVKTQQKGWLKCRQCPGGLTSSGTGATDDSGCTSIVSH